MNKFQVGDKVAVNMTGVVTSTEPYVKIEVDGEGEENFWAVEDDDDMWKVTAPGHSFGFQDGDVVYHTGLNQFYAYYMYEDYWGCTEPGASWSVWGTVKTGVENGEIVLVVRGGKPLFKMKKQK
jgi:hypothetical protein